MKNIVEKKIIEDPFSIIVYFGLTVDEGGNPRIDYGLSDDWDDFKDSIAIEGLRQNIKIFFDDKGRPHLSHGYRRLKAILELIGEDRWTGGIIEYDIVSGDPVETLVDHIIMNTGKPLTDLEKAMALKKLSNMTGITKTSDLAKRVSMRVQKVAKLMTFMERAKPEIISRLSKNEMSFDTAYRVVTKANSPRDQLKLLKEGIRGMQATGGKKILQKHLTPVRKTLDYNSQLGLLIGDAQHLSSVDKGFLTRLQTLINLIKEQAPYTEQIAIFKNEEI